MHVDERGRVWVCEALNYRNTHNPENPSREKGDRILILEDTDGDAKADKSTVFYQGTDVNAALGIWATDNHAIVSCSPYVFLLSDTNGDDKADTKDTLFTGLGGEQSDHAIHSFIQGADGKLYFNFGNNGQQIMDRHGKPVIDMSGNTVNNKGTPYRQGMVVTATIPMAATSKYWRTTSATTMKWLPTLTVHFGNPIMTTMATWACASTTSWNTATMVTPIR
ncbi:MAG: hypothetical protein IPO07_11355 [Haliscomenobacter sp.]|nr:PVC-type heme-binding CxxCH protein [Haliscomenobacter sp.]MBK9489311.1 hypothetical protein [Haliscomenobacter sp.]